ncbi:unnamed protein product [Miscanthus lutarioriparius]|uniref:Uncharacterized protein n=1 Tax=Miscanthus lutarioriparius TaxID=422564 RepID=A0A811RAL1_9POAL|nr:unnamed protein product [Miscanthus lutarioriparius]
MGLLRFCWCWLAAAPCLLHCSLLLASAMLDLNSSFLEPQRQPMIIITGFNSDVSIQRKEKQSQQTGSSIKHSRQPTKQDPMSKRTTMSAAAALPLDLVLSFLATGASLAADMGPAWLLGDGGLDGLIRGRCAFLLLVDGIGLRRRRHGGHLGHGRDWSDSWRVGNGSATVGGRGDGSRGGRAGVAEKAGAAAGAGRGRALAAALG